MARAKDDFAMQIQQRMQEEDMLQQKPETLQKEEEPAPYLASLNQEQLLAVRHSGSNLLVHAGAGSGKTRVVIARILYHIFEQNIAPWQILAVTFTNRATREMRERLAASLGEDSSQRVLIRTFHAFGAWFLRRHAAAAGLSTSFSIYDEDDSDALLKQAWPDIERKKVKTLRYAIAKAKDSGFGYDLPHGQYPAVNELEQYWPSPDFPQAFIRYQEALHRSGNADFADLLGLPVRILQSNAEIRQQMQGRFRRILVDEYQDSNPLQNRLLHLLLRSTEAAPRPESSPSKQQELCIVGDEDQSIYGFRGAEIRHILEFPQNFAPAHIVKLEQNYRSCAPILALANQVIGLNRTRLGKELRATKSGAKLPQCHYFESHEEEAVFVAQCIQRAPQLRSAILYRTNAQSRIFERVFREWNIPYRLIGNLSFYRREEIKDVVAYLKCLANPFDMVSFERIYNKPKRGLGASVFATIQVKLHSLEGEESPVQTSVESAPFAGVAAAMKKVLEEKALASRSLKGLAQFAHEFCSLINLLGNFGLEYLDQDGATIGTDATDSLEEGLQLVEFMQEVLQRSGLLSYYQERDELEGSERCLNFDSLLEEAQHYGCGRRALVAFLESIELETEELDVEDQDAVIQQREAEQQTLITMHNTKGLEFQRVFITGLELGIFPKFDVLNDVSQMEEERRLFYVAITRAEEELYLSAAQFRFLYGQSQFREISPLLREINPILYEDCSPASIIRKASIYEQQSKLAEMHSSVDSENLIGQSLATSNNVDKLSKKHNGANRDDLSACKQISPDVLHAMSKGKIKPGKKIKKEKKIDPFVVGARIEHLDYGLGYVVQRKRSADINTLMIKLDDGRLIRIQLEFQGHKLDFLGTGL